MGKKKIVVTVILLAGVLAFQACNKTSSINYVSNAVYDDTPYILEYGNNPEPFIPVDNPLTIQGVQLGRMLFYEKRLSSDNTMSCASCHKQANAFNDTNRFSTGVLGHSGSRQSMAIFNLGWHANEFFWDGRAEQLRDQALMPIEDTLELNESLQNVISKLSSSQMYLDQFVRAFGSNEITAEKMALALEQFMLSIVSFNSRWDQMLRGEILLSEEEELGRAIFFRGFDPNEPETGAGCARCHVTPNFENDFYQNNGLDTDADMTDLGRYEVTGQDFDKGKFKVPSLRNIELTPPYMHDGRFKTLEEVIEHYNSGIQVSTSVDPGLEQIANLGFGMMLSQKEKDYLVAFLKSLTDESLITNSEYSNPFE